MVAKAKQIAEENVETKIKLERSMDTQKLSSNKGNEEKQIGNAVTQLPKCGRGSNVNKKNEKCTRNKKTTLDPDSIAETSSEKNSVCGSIAEAMDCKAAVVDPGGKSSTINVSSPNIVSVGYLKMSPRAEPADAKCYSRKMNTDEKKANKPVSSVQETSKQKPSQK